MEETIAAISTALGIGAISIIRVSGNEAIQMVNQIFKGSDLTQKESHTIVILVRSMPLKYNSPLK